jgi:hypothetical protein
MFQTAIQFSCERHHPERAYGVGAAGFEPGVFTRNKGRDGLFTILDGCANQSICEIHALLK